VKHTQCYLSAAHNPKAGCANVLSNASSTAQVCGWNCAHQALPDKTLLNYARIANAVQVRKKTFVFLVWL